MQVCYRPREHTGGYSVSKSQLDHRQVCIPSQEGWSFDFLPASHLFFLSTLFTLVASAPQALLAQPCDLFAATTRA